jgi:diadenosine tetraphosphate (Ap4A) HIT family hydrolase
VSEGHLLIVPRRHVPTWFDASEEERAAITTAVDRGRELIESRHHPDGFNIGINVGEAAGQTVFHLHAHLIPRYSGDVPDPRGGVRHVIPDKGNYLAPPIGADWALEGRSSVQRAWAESPRRVVTGPAPAPRLVSGGEEDPLYRYLREELAQAATADIAVGFVMPSGLDRLEPHLREFLGKRGRLRLLTGDYLGVTEPEALARLLDRVRGSSQAGEPEAPSREQPKPRKRCPPSWARLIAKVYQVDPLVCSRCGTYEPNRVRDRPGDDREDPRPSRPQHARRGQAATARASRSLRRRRPVVYEVRRRVLERP